MNAGCSLARGDHPMREGDGASPSRGRRRAFTGAASSYRPAGSGEPVVGAVCLIIERKLQASLQALLPNVAASRRWGCVGLLPGR